MRSRILNYLEFVTIWRVLDRIGHETSSKRWRLERFTILLSKADLDRLLNKGLRAPSFGGGCLIPITVPYSADLTFKSSNIANIVLSTISLRHNCALHILFEKANQTMQISHKVSGYDILNLTQ